MRNDFESNYLAHHGILGMKWGKKNGPPYPLGASDHSAAEKKAGWRKSLGSGRNESLYNSKRAYKQTKRIIGKTRPYENYKILNSKNESRITEMVNKNITDEQKTRLKALLDEHKKLSSKTKSGHSEKADAAFRAYNEETKKVAREILGKYGSKKLNTFTLDDTTYGDIVQRATKWSKIIDKEESSTGSKKNDKVKSVTSKKQPPSKTAVWNKSSSYNAGFLNYIKEAVVKPEMVDDPELLDLLVWEYEEATGKKAMKS